MERASEGAFGTKEIGTARESDRKRDARATKAAHANGGNPPKADKPGRSPLQSGVR
jgi:hypothetical protein